jgi:hypothetical protein
MLYNMYDEVCLNTWYHMIDGVENLSGIGQQDREDGCIKISFSVPLWGLMLKIIFSHCLPNLINPILVKNGIYWWFDPKIVYSRLAV